MFLPGAPTENTENGPWISYSLIGKQYRTQGFQPSSPCPRTQKCLYSNLTGSVETICGLKAGEFHVRCLHPDSFLVCSAPQPPPEPEEPRGRVQGRQSGRVGVLGKAYCGRGADQGRSLQKPGSTASIPAPQPPHQLHSLQTSPTPQRDYSNHEEDGHVSTQPTSHLREGN